MSCLVLAAVALRQWYLWHLPAFQYSRFLSCSSLIPWLQITVPHFTRMTFDPFLKACSSASQLLSVFKVLLVLLDNLQVWLVHFLADGVLICSSIFTLWKPEHFRCQMDKQLSLGLTQLTICHLWSRGWIKADSIILVQYGFNWYCLIDQQDW